MDASAMRGRIGPASVHGGQVWIPGNSGTRFKVPRRKTWIRRRMSARLFGLKVAGIEVIPRPLRARFERDYPGWLEEPGI